MERNLTRYFRWAAYTQNYRDVQIKLPCPSVSLLGWIIMYTLHRASVTSLLFSIIFCLFWNKIYWQILVLQNSQMKYMIIISYACIKNMTKEGLTILLKMHVPLFIISDMATLKIPIIDDKQSCLIHYYIINFIHIR